MIPTLLRAAVSAYLALEGYSLLTAPPSLVRDALSRVREDMPPEEAISMMEWGGAGSITL
ncbi:hypothetical protein MCP1_20260 [Candidatus Terasakiella magnetica]|nr:hypothetical protein MCP1_20260 [Candidatus Terasakiella magnetica]